MAVLLLKGALIGLGATLLMDLWALVLARLPGQSAPNWAPVGRWFRHLPRGVVFHDDIARAEASPNDLRAGWIAHYAVGILYGVLFAVIAGPGWFAAPRFLPAWIFALLTIAAGWFLLQPGMGLGWAASRTANPAKVRILGLVAHTVFGLGLYLTALLIAPAAG